MFKQNHILLLKTKVLVLLEEVQSGLFSMLTGHNIPDNEVLMQLMLIIDNNYQEQVQGSWDQMYHKGKGIVRILCRMKCCEVKIKLFNHRNKLII